jgi:hypothetical protein
VSDYHRVTRLRQHQRGAVGASSTQTPTPESIGAPAGATGFLGFNIASHLLGRAVPTITAEIAT